MGFLEALKTRVVKKGLKERGVLTLEDHPLVKKAKHLLFVSRTEAGVGAIGYMTWGINHFLAPTPEAATFNNLLGVGLLVSSLISVNRNSMELERFIASFDSSALSRLTPE